MKTLGVALAFLLALYVDSIGCADEVTECGTGTACFSDGQLPDWVSPASTAYYCCLQRNMTESGNRLPNGTYNCNCVLDLTLPARIEAWAVATRHQGRMCVRDDCEGSAVTTTASERFHYCCHDSDSANVTSAITFIDGDKEEFIGCRCVNQPVPTPDPQDYVVPPVMDYNSTGEVCSYDNACQDRPALKCQLPGVTDVTFCCYGSRGLVTQNDVGGAFTRCTCSDEVYGAQCEPRPIAIAQTTLHEVTECGTGTACFSDGQLPDWVSPASTAYYCCLQRNMTESGNRLPNGTYNCNCVLDLTLPARIEAWAVATRHQGRMCVRDDCEGSAVTTTASERFHYCCHDSDSANVTSAITFIDGDKEEFIGCRCVNQPVPTPDPQDYVVPPVMDYNSTGEVCSYDNACQDRPALKCQLPGVTDVTFCCYGSRGLVTQNDVGGAFTRCTCSDEVYGAQCEPRPIAIAQTTLPCLTDCDDVAEEDKCVDSSKAERCCPLNMAVLADQSEGNFTSCTCKARATRNCDTNPTSSAVHLGGRVSDVMLLVWTLLFTGYIGL